MGRQLRSECSSYIGEDVPALNKNNKGFLMIQKMGWRGRGFGIGKYENGISDPIQVQNQFKQEGLGFRRGRIRCRDEIKRIQYREYRKWMCNNNKSYTQLNFTAPVVESGILQKEAREKIKRETEREAARVREREKEMKQGLEWAYKKYKLQKIQELDEDEYVPDRVDSGLDHELRKKFFRCWAKECPNKVFTNAATLIIHQKKHQP